MVRIRKARESEFARLNEIETVADEIFATVGLHVVLSMPNATHERLRQGPVWVACDDADRAIGFALAGEIDDFAVLEQLSVLPDHGRKGVGGALIREVADWARRQGYDTLVLSTYRDIAWNQGYYERQGFDEMPETAFGNGIRAMNAEHVLLGHDPARRMMMWKRLS